MIKAPRFTRSIARSWLIDRMFSFSGGDYQRQRFPQEKVDRILAGVDMARIASVLDIGCNEGVITNYFSAQGKFSVGIDVAPYFLRGVLQDVHRRTTPAFGVFNLSLSNVESLPVFDLVLLLSVHHWWVKAHGDDYAKELVSALMSRAKRYFVMEFSSIGEKYGYTEPRFIDHDEESLKAYAVDWLKSINPAMKVTYLGSNKETAGRERMRYIFMVDKES